MIPIVYLDNAATTFPKPKCVYRETEKFVRSSLGNPGRSAHHLSLRSAEAVYRVREQIGAMLSFPMPERVVFSQNATYALNQAIKGFVPAGAHVLISDLEHNSVLRPLYMLEKSFNVKISVFSSKGNIEENIRSMITKDTSFLISTLSSNVTGKRIPIELLSRLRREYSLFVIADASQNFGHETISLLEHPIDVLCAPGHKGAFGLAGCGFSVIVTDRVPKTSIEGGSGSDSLNPLMPNELPERLEAGTLPVPSIVSLGAGLRYLSTLGEGFVTEKIQDLTTMLYDRLYDIPGIQFLDHPCNGIISFNINGYTSNQVSAFLDQKGIMTRSGLHCAPLAHKKYETEDNGAVRVSVSIQNSRADLDALRRALKTL